MLVCIAGLAVLYVFLDGSAANLPLVMLALAIFGIGQGLFISPNSSAIMATAPPELTGEAGSVLNVVRFSASAPASPAPRRCWRSGSAAGARGQHARRPVPLLVAASRDVIVLLGCLAALAGVLSLIRPRTSPAAD